jgi:hypothetical protein
MSNWTGSAGDAADGALAAWGGLVAAGPEVCAGNIDTNIA